MRKRSVAVLLAVGVFGLSACENIPGTKEHGLARAKAAVKVELVDPESAQFSEIRSDEMNVRFCGLVNSKNRYGGYAGPTRFVWSEAGGAKVETKALSSDDQCYFDASWDACTTGDTTGTLRCVEAVTNRSRAILDRMKR